jgi:hypothetical protein
MEIREMSNKITKPELNWKKVLSETLKKLKIIDERWTGEITIGINEGGIRFIRRSETLK